MAFIPDAPTKFVPDAAPDPIETANAAANKEEDTQGGPIQHVIDMIRAAPSGVIPALKGFVDQIADPYGSAFRMGKGIKAIADNPDAALSTVKNATPQQVGANVVAPLLVGGALGKGVGLAFDASEAASAAAATPARQLGLRTTADSPIAAKAAGTTAGPTLDIQNQAVASRALGADAGVPADVPVNHTSLAAAAVKPGTLLDQAADLIPQGPLSQEAINQVRAARGPQTITPGSPDVENYVNEAERRLTDPNATFSGAQIRATRNLLNGEAATGMQSADPAQRALAQYKKGVVSALDQHVADSLPQGSPITPDMVQNARATLAKNYNLRDLIGKGGDIDLQALAADHRANPNKFTGPTRTVAQFASDHPEVTGNISDANRIAPPSLAGDLSHINILNPRTWVQPIIGGIGRAGLRGSGATEAAASTPVAGAAGEFEPLPMTGLQPPPGRAFTPHQPTLATGAPTQPDFFGTGANGLSLGDELAGHGAAPAAGAPGDISLADLLSHGVEQSPAPGLSAGPMGEPRGEGIPFQINADHAAGGLSLGDLLSGAAPEANSDMAHVMSQGVPEGTMTRTTPQGSPEMMEGGGFKFRSPNGQTIARKRGDQLQVSASLTKQTAQGAGEGTQRMIDAHNFAQANGLNLVSDTKVSEAAAKVYDRLENMGYEITRNPSESDGKGNLLSTSGRPVFEVHGPSDSLADLLTGTGGG